MPGDQRRCSPARRGTRSGPADIPEALESLRYTLDVFDDNGNLIEVLARIGELDIALAAFRAALDMRRNNLVMLRDKGRVLRRSDEPKE